MNIACLDLEGVLVPEIWIGVAEKTGIDDLRKTTRDIPDYDELMRGRLEILEKHNLGIDTVQEVISELGPLDGAFEFLSWLRERMQVIILSDTFYEFANPLMKQLDYPTLFCHSLEISDEGKISNYFLRQKDQKRQAVQAFHALNFQTIAAGDSYNDTAMLMEANQGILFCPPEKVIKEFPSLPVTRNYDELREAFLRSEEAIAAKVSR